MSRQLTRQWAILRLLYDRPDGQTVKQLADRFEVSKNTITRDLADLLDAGFAVSVEARGQTHIYRLDRGVRHLVGRAPSD